MNDRLGKDNIAERGKAQASRSSDLLLLGEATLRLNPEVHRAKRKRKRERKRERKKRGAHVQDPGQKSKMHTLGRLQNPAGQQTGAPEL